MNFDSKLVLMGATLALATTSAFAANDTPELNGYIGKTSQEISSALKERGYQVRKVELEDGYLEAYALKNGERFEIYVDPTTGVLVKSKRD